VVRTGAEAARAAVKASGVKLCALGRDALALTEAGYSCAVTPQESSTQGLVMELTARGEAEGARVVRPDAVAHPAGVSPVLQP
jgi:uroporphyrinogen-III synthase